MGNSTYDLVILGCGPAGLSAAINASIRNKKVMVIGSEQCSPPMHKAQKINNYLGFPDISGAELLDHFYSHFLRTNIEIVRDKAEMISESEGIYNVLINDELIKSKTIIISTGIPYKPTFPDEEKFLGMGLGYCATCDGPIYRDKDILLIGYSSEAEYEAKFMAEICHQVYYVPLYKSGENNLDKRVNIIKQKPVQIIGSEYVEGVKLQNGDEIKIDGLFILGAETSPERLLPGLDIEDNHIKVNRNQETNLSGVFAAGDCTGKPYQVAKAVGEGQVAGLNASKYASKH